MYLKSLFGLISSGHIREACQLARKHRDLRLNLLLAQCSRGSTVFRELLKKQLSVWDKIGATDFIMAERLRVYALLAGLIVWETGKLTLSSCSDVEWQRNLAVHLWLVCVHVCEYVCVYMDMVFTFISYCVSLGTVVILLLQLRMH